MPGLGVLQPMHLVLICFISLIMLLPFAAILVILARRTQPSAVAATPTTANMKKCPYCAEMIRPEAIVCRYCGRDLPIAPVP